MCLVYSHCAVPVARNDKCVSRSTKSHVFLYKGTALYGCKTKGWWLQLSIFYEMAAIKSVDYL